MPVKLLQDQEPKPSERGPDRNSDPGPHFQPGGPLDSGYRLYVEREADVELVESLQAGHLCYVLAPRQSGKSSLRIRTIAKLRDNKVTCISVDLSGLGGKESKIDQWYESLLSCISSDLDISFDVLDKFLDTQRGVTPAQKFTTYIKTLLLPARQEPIVIFFDEIDSIRTLNFSNDDFFTSIRSIYSLRAENKNYQRLTFCLLGTVAPSDLIQNIHQTPFNNGRSIYLSDFSVLQARLLADGLAQFEERSSLLLERALWWTSGHPYMTQRILWELTARNSSDVKDATIVDQIVSSIFIKRGRTEDINLSSMERYFEESPRSRKIKLLAYYLKLLADELIPVNRTDPIQLALRLIGVVSEKEDNGALCLTVRNQIVRQVFGTAWATDRKNECLRAEPLSKWLESGRQERFLLNGPMLLEAIEVARSKHFDLDSDEAEYIISSLLLKISPDKGKTILQEAELVKATNALIQQITHTIDYNQKFEEKQERSHLIAAGKRRLLLMLGLLFMACGIVAGSMVYSFSLSVALPILTLSAAATLILLSYFDNREIRILANLRTKDSDEQKEIIGRIEHLHHTVQSHIQNLLVERNFLADKVFEVQRRNPRFKRLKSTIGVIGVAASGKTSLCLRLTDPIFSDVNTTLRTSRSEEYERSVAIITNARDATRTEFVFCFKEWGGEYLVQAQADMLRSCERRPIDDDAVEMVQAGIQALILVVDIACPEQSVAENNLGRQRPASLNHVLNHQRIREQIERYFGASSLSFLLNPHIMAYLQTIVLFINKADVLSGTPEQNEEEAKRLYHDLIDNLQKIYPNCHVVVGSASTDTGLLNLSSILADNILPEAAKRHPRLSRWRDPDLRGLDGSDGPQILNTLPPAVDDGAN